MQSLKIERLKKFERELKKLSQKHPGLAENLEIILDDIIAGKTDGKLLKGYGEDKLFKIRCGTRNMGQRKGARVYYYKDDSVIVLLGIFFKNQQPYVSHEELMKRLVRYLQSQSLC